MNARERAKENAQAKWSWDSDERDVAAEGAKVASDVWEPIALDLLDMASAMHRAILDGDPWDAHIDRIGEKLLEYKEVLG